MTRFADDLEMLGELIDRLTGFSAHLDGVRDDVAGRMERVEAVWTGRAAAEGGAAYRQWTSSAAEMQDALATLRSISSTARANYNAALAANAEMWSG